MAGIRISLEDQAYIAMRNGLIYAAEVSADRAWGWNWTDRLVEHKLSKKEWDARWTRTFHNRMAELVREAGKCART